MLMLFGDSASPVLSSLRKFFNLDVKIWTTTYSFTTKIETIFLNLMLQLMRLCRYSKRTSIQATWALAGQKKGKL